MKKTKNLSTPSVERHALPSSVGTRAVQGTLRWVVRAKRVTGSSRHFCADYKGRARKINSRQVKIGSRFVIGYQYRKPISKNNKMSGDCSVLYGNHNRNRRCVCAGRKNHPRPCKLHCVFTQPFDNHDASRSRPKTRRSCLHVSFPQLILSSPGSAAQRPVSVSPR